MPCRRVIAETVAADPDTYTEGFLGKGNQEYQRWIQDSQKWGGAIELSILSRQVLSYFHSLNPHEDMQISSRILQARGYHCQCRPHVFQHAELCMCLSTIALLADALLHAKKWVHSSL